MVGSKTRRFLGGITVRVSPDGTTGHVHEKDSTSRYRRLTRAA